MTDRRLPGGTPADAGDRLRLASALVEQVFARASGAPLVGGNDVRLLRDARQNYPAWLEAIGSARRTIHFESYIIHEDETGREFALLLMARARAGVQVRIIYDWLGAVGKTSKGFWRDLRKCGVEVRCFNPPRLSNPFAWLSRDHRKMLAVDGRVGFVTGLCVGRSWVGDPARGIEPWRDTGISLRGPAVADLELAFSRMWALTGVPLPSTELSARDDATSPEGDVSVRVIASMPGTAELYRLDQLIAAASRRTLWLTDAYFVGTTAYVQALRAAARDGVDVRLLVPGATDIWVLRGLSRVGYRPLLEGGVRVYEWKGSMLHAKTAVADGRWARVGSTNLNLQSWIGNWELDVAVEDEGVAGQMQEMYLDDLGNATEIMLTRRARLARTAEAPRPGAGAVGEHRARSRRGPQRRQCRGGGHDGAPGAGSGGSQNHGNGGDCATRAGPAGRLLAPGHRGTACGDRDVAGGHPARPGMEPSP